MCGANTHSDASHATCAISQTFFFLFFLMGTAALYREICVAWCEMLVSMRCVMRGVRCVVLMCDAWCEHTFRRITQYACYLTGTFNKMRDVWYVMCGANTHSDASHIMCCYPTEHIHCDECREECGRMPCIFFIKKKRV